MLTLAIAHNLFLTQEERKTLASGKTIESIGVSVPVWFYKGDTSEPAVEVFSKYLLTNAKQDYPISTTGSGYKINMPQLPEDYKEPPKLSNEKWRKMNKEDMRKWYEDTAKPPTGENLLDIKDGGAEFLKFKRHNKVKKQGKMIDIIHFIEIKTVKELELTLA